jgi:hypothetical protein
MVLSVDRTAPPERAGWLAELARQARGHARLEGAERRWHLERKP